jgi:hypothetical protein
MAPRSSRGKSFGRAHLNGGDCFTGNVRRTLGLFIRGGLCHPLVAAVPPPLFTSDKREASLGGGNCGVQKCDSVDPLSLVIKCLGGGGTSQGT